MLERGYLQDCTDLEGLDDTLRAGVVPAYIGYDATAASRCMSAISSTS